MASDQNPDADTMLQLFCTAKTWEYSYLGPLQELLDYRYPTKPFPVLHALADQGKVFKMISKKAVKITRGSQYDENAVACDYLRLHVYGGKLIGSQRQGQHRHHTHRPVPRDTACTRAWSSSTGQAHRGSNPGPGVDKTA
jgi:hypothetical protein